MKEIKGRDIYPNVDLYSASLYYMLKIPMDLNTPIFAVSRVVGWAAHIIEEKFAEAAPKPAVDAKPGCAACLNTLAPVLAANGANCFAPCCINPCPVKAPTANSPALEAISVGKPSAMVPSVN